MDIVSALVQFPATNVDVVLGDEGLPLAAVRDSWQDHLHARPFLGVGQCFAGHRRCLCRRFSDERISASPESPGLPIFAAEDIEKVKASWRHLLNEGAKTVYPSPREAICGTSNP